MSLLKNVGGMTGALGWCDDKFYDIILASSCVQSFHPPFAPCLLVFIFLFHLTSFILQPCFRGIVCDMSPPLTDSISMKLDTGL
jgi:hypothetical protein